MEQPAFARDQQFADLGRRQPVDVEYADGVVGEAHQAGQQVFVLGVDAPGRLGVDAGHLGAGQVAHNVHVMGRQVNDHAHIAHAGRERPQPPGVDLEDPAQVARRQPRLSATIAGL